MVVVASDQAPLQAGNQVLGRLQEGERLSVPRVRENWLWVETAANRKNVRGLADPLAS